MMSKIPLRMIEGGGSTTVEHPQDLESEHRSLCNEGFNLSNGPLSYFLGKYFEDADRPDEADDLSAIYLHEEGKIRRLEYTGEFSELKEFYSSVMDARELEDCEWRKEIRYPSG